MKRLLDIFVASLALLSLWPIIAIISALVWLQLGRPILFRQMRPGYKGKPFLMRKFRSMHSMRDTNGDLSPDADRLGSFGRFLRGSSLDELPQLWSVLRGDMSLVGPRPLLMEYLSLYTPEQKRRHETRPGITGWAQIHGRNAVNWEEKFKLDVWYVDNRSFWLDIKILFLSAYVVLTRKGISAQGEATMPKFKGTVEK
jgi:lipopolysaccharide/colanic/teichoic acid biosynthesis glycosyltransferase